MMTASKNSILSVGRTGQAEKMAKIIWSPNALDDIDAIAEFFWCT